LSKFFKYKGYDVNDPISADRRSERNPLAYLFKVNDLFGQIVIFIIK